ncbi:MAG: hypothetical protein PUD85_04620 [Bacteroidales bacterium]|nr:hypothetical protein [Bacteroidales bacterium]
MSKLQLNSQLYIRVDERESAGDNFAPRSFHAVGTGEALVAQAPGQVDLAAAL